MSNPITAEQQRTLYRVAAFTEQYGAVVEAALKVYEDYFREMAELPGPKASVETYEQAADKARAAAVKWNELCGVEE